ncbi:MAG TPA: AtpZ/AtpI family protein [Candidatus Binatia bacterium]|nr:AtpZ/AtpI family protein [Candidatus Binatia bacterium]
MQRETSPGPARILGEVTLIMLATMLGGVVVGLLLDAQAGTSPIFVLGGLVLGSLASAIGIWFYIRFRRSRPRSTDPEHQP